MTSNERAEFEKQKQKAERQINEMYYGKGGGLKMPNFLSPAGEVKRQGALQSSKNPPAPQKAERQKSQGSRVKNEEPLKAVGPDGQSKKPSIGGNTGLNILNMLNLKNLTMDSDRLTVLALCLLLSTDEVDELLLLALVYIML